LLFTGCTSDAERIADQNAAAGTSEPGARTDFGRISVFDLRAGDCLGDNEIFDEESETEFAEQGSVSVVRCDGSDVYGRVAQLYLVEGEGADFPGDEQVIALAESTCARPAGLFTYLVPVEESWDQGDRTITCIDLVGFAYESGDCIAAPEQDHRVIPCESEGVFADVIRVLDLAADYTSEAPFPDQSAFDAGFDEQCAADSDYLLSPTADTWAAGDRLVVCVKTR
jgi:hypothetical protein